MANKLQGSVGGTISLAGNGDDTFTYKYEGSNHSVVNLIRLSELTAPGTADVTARVYIRTEGAGGDVPVPTIPDGETDDDSRITIPGGGSVRIPTLICPQRGDELRVELDNTSSSARTVNILAAQASAPVAQTEV